MSAAYTPLPLVVGPDELDERTPFAALYGADFSALSITPSHGHLAPQTVRLALARFAPWDAQQRVDLLEHGAVVDLGDAQAARMTWDDAFAAIKSRAGAAALQPFSVGLGGDHSVSWPIVAGIAEQRGRVGVVQLDVHHDVRPLDDGPSNGTPIRGLIESGVIAATDVVQVGIHPFANRRPLTEYCDAHGIRRYTLDDIAEHGPAAVIRSALADLDGVDAIHLTVDIDVLDRAFAPGTVAALPGGLTPQALVAAVRAAVADERTTSMDVVEFDPSRDVSDCTAYNVALTVMSALAARVRR